MCEKGNLGGLGDGSFLVFCSRRGISFHLRIFFEWNYGEGKLII